MSDDSKLRLLNVQLDSSQRNQIYFPSKNNRDSYFYNLSDGIGNKTPLSVDADKFRYLKRDNTIVIDGYIDNFYNYNYCMMRNGDSERWIYSFIEDMEYVSETATKLILKEDVFQTWFLDCVVHPSFVEREHVLDDSIGANTYPEMLESGAPYNYATSEIVSLRDLAFFVFTTKLNYVSEDSFDRTYYGRNLNGIPCGVICLMFTEESVPRLGDWLNDMGGAGKADAVLSVFCAPRILAGKITSVQEPNSGQHINVFDGSHQSVIYNYPNNRPLSINGYKPKNNKLLVYPYNFLVASNHHGQVQEYRYEYFGDANNINFKIEGGISANTTAVLIPQSYNGVTNNFDESITLSDFPLLAFAYSAFSAWLAQNAVSIPAGLLASTTESGLGIAGSIATANPFGLASSIASGVSGVAGTISQVYSHSIQPPISKGNMSGSVAIGCNVNNFAIIQKQIRAEYARKIDEFFEMYGYKICRLKVPNMSFRPHWNYVKTIDINISGPVPSREMSLLKDIFNKGVTLWKSNGEIGNYTLNNH